MVGVEVTVDVCEGCGCCVCVEIGVEVLVVDGVRVFVTVAVFVAVGVRVGNAALVTEGVNPGELVTVGVGSIGLYST